MNTQDLIPVRIERSYGKDDGYTFVVFPNGADRNN